MNLLLSLPVFMEKNVQTQNHHHPLGLKIVLWGEHGVWGMNVGLE